MRFANIFIFLSVVVIAVALFQVFVLSADVADIIGLFITGVAFLCHGIFIKLLGKINGK